MKSILSILRIRKLNKKEEESEEKKCGIIIRIFKKKYPDARVESYFGGAHMIQHGVLRLGKRMNV